MDPGESAAAPTVPTVSVTGGTVRFDPQSYSVLGNQRAAAFARFARLPLSRATLHGNVLDVGCGPQPVPVYLDHLPLDRLYGLDPVAGAHPFTFRQGVAEHLPWPDASFAAVVCATVLDHVADPAVAAAELWRVLQPGGTLLSWETVLPEGEHGPDAHHASRFTQPSLLALFRPWFEPAEMTWYREGLRAGAAECFSRWTPRPVATSVHRLPRRPPRAPLGGSAARPAPPLAPARARAAIVATAAPGLVALPVRE